MRLVSLYPNLPSCDDCEQWQYDPRDWRILERGGQRLKRFSKTPCGQCPKVGKDKPPCRASAEELSSQNWQAYSHYLGCRATNTWPDDERVRRNAALIRQVEDAAARGNDELLAGVLITMAEAARRERGKR